MDEQRVAQDIFFKHLNLQGEGNAHQDVYEKEGRPDETLEEARLALLERTIDDIKVVALGPTSIKVRGNEVQILKKKCYM